MSGRAAAGALALFVALLAIYSHDRWFAGSDTFKLLDGVAVVDRCIEEGVYRDCGGAGFGDPAGYAPLQYLPTLAFKRLGASREQAIQYLVWLNTAAFVGVLLLLWTVGRRFGRGTTALLVLAGLAGPLLWYAGSGFGEALAAFFVAGFAAAVALGWHPVVVVAAFLFAALAKLPNVLFLGAIAIAMLGGRHFAGTLRRRDVAAVGIGVVASVVALGWVDHFRGGSVSSYSYVPVPHLMPDWSGRIENAVGLVAAPNAGILWFWPAASIALVLAAAVAWRARRGPDRGRAWAWLGVTTAAGALALSIASYFSPFGWEAWGARYLVPWVAAFALLGAALFGGEIEARIARARARAPMAGLALCAVVAVAGLAHVGARVDITRAYSLFEPDQECGTRLRDPTGQSRAEAREYFDCTRHIAWGKPPVLVDAAGGVAGGWGLALGGSFLLAAGALVAYGWAAPRQQPGQSERERDRPAEVEAV